MRKFLAIAALLVSAVSAQASTKYTLDTSHGQVGFKVPHLVITSVYGRFDKWTGEFMFDEKTGKLEGITAKIDVDSINTNEPKRDEHLKSADFFGVRSKEGKIVEAKRWMTFTGTKVNNKGNKPTTVTGDLTMNGITKPVTLKVEYKGTVKDPWGNQKLGFTASTKIDRKDFGLTWSKTLETGGLVVGNDVEITIEGEATAAATAVQ